MPTLQILFLFEDYLWQRNLKVFLQTAFPGLH